MPGSEIQEKSCRRRLPRALPAIWGSLFSLTAFLLPSLYGDPLAGSIYRPVTLADRLSFVQKRITELQDAQKSVPSAKRSILQKKQAFRELQLFCLQEQWTLRNKSRTLDPARYSSVVMEILQEKYAEFAVRPPDKDMDLEFADDLLEAIQSGKVDPNMKITLPGRPGYSGVLLGSFLAPLANRLPLPQREQIIQTLLAQGADTSLLRGENVIRNASRTGLLFNGAWDKMQQLLLPMLSPVSPDPEYRAIHLLWLAHNVIEQDAHGNTALHLAVSKGYAELTELILLADGDPNARNKQQETPLFSAMRSGHPELCTLLLQYGADPTLRNNKDEDYTRMKIFGNFETAIRKNDLSALEKCLQGKLDPDMLLSSGQYPLGHACRSGNLPMVRLLLKHKADPNIGHPAAAPLRLALQAGKNSSEIFKLLLDAGADPNGKLPETVLEELCKGIHFPHEKLRCIAHLLANKETSLYSGRQEQLSIVNIALSYPPKKPEPLIRMLIKATPAFHKDDPVLALAVARGSSTGILRMLLHQKANINAPVRCAGGIYASPLYIAVASGQTETVSFLCRNGADKEYRDNRGRSIRELPTTPEIRRILR